MTDVPTLLPLGVFCGAALIAYTIAKHSMKEPHQPLSPRSSDNRRGRIANPPDPNWTGGYTGTGSWCAAGMCMAHRDPLTGAIVAVAVDTMAQYHEQYEADRQTYFEKITTTNHVRDDFVFDSGRASEPREAITTPRWYRQHDEPALPPPPVPVYQFQGTGDVIQQDSGLTREQEWDINNGGAQVDNGPTGPEIVHVRVGR